MKCKVKNRSISIFEKLMNQSYFFVVLSTSDRNFFTFLWKNRNFAKKQSIMHLASKFKKYFRMYLFFSLLQTF